MRATRSTLLLVCAALFSIGAAVIHAIVTPEHFEEWWGYGAFFLVATIAQAVFGLLLIVQLWRVRMMSNETRSSSDRFTRLICMVGIVGNLAIIALWIVTRTSGIPVFGPHVGEVEEVTGIDLASKVIEAAPIICLMVWLRDWRATPLKNGLAHDR